MIYNLNGEVHWELSAELMQELVCIVNHRILNRPPIMPDRLMIELCNFRGALANELDRMADKPELADKLADNTDLIA